MRRINEQYKEIIQNEKKRRILRLSFLFILLFFFLSFLFSSIIVKENKEYGDFRHIVAYIFKYEELPKNYIPKSLSFTVEGEDLYLYEIFNNNERLLPLNAIYISAYLNSTKNNVGAERIVFSATDIYYTDNHYLSFTEVTRFDIYGFHYVSLSLFCLMIAGGSLLVWISVKNEYITIAIIKTDFKSDTKWLVVKIKKLIINIKNYFLSKKR
jgi:hypothetical protein